MLSQVRLHLCEMTRNLHVVLQISSSATRTRINFRSAMISLCAFFSPIIDKYRSSTPTTRRTLALIRLSRRPGLDHRSRLSQISILVSACTKLTLPYVFTTNSRVCCWAHVLVRRSKSSMRTRELHSGPEAECTKMTWT